MEDMNLPSQEETMKPLENPNRMKKINRKTAQFMKSVRDFLTVKGGGEIPTEWELSLLLLETYYKQFLMATVQLEEVGTLLVESRYGPQENALLKIQSRAATRLEKQMSELGLSLKSGAKLGVTEPKKEETALDKFLKGKTR